MFAETAHKFPVLPLREFVSETRGNSGVLSARMMPKLTRSREIACIFPWNREF
jgi:hypothetical protein